MLYLLSFRTSGDPSSEHSERSCRRLTWAEMWVDPEEVVPWAEPDEVAAAGVEDSRP